MPAVRQDQPRNGGTRTRLDAVELGKRAVFVIAALDEQHRRADGAGEVLDAPGSELGRQPGVGPAEKGVVDPRMVFGQAAAEAARVAGARAVDGADLGDALKAHGLD